MRVAVGELLNGEQGLERLVVLDGERMCSLDHFPSGTPLQAFDHVSGVSPDGGFCALLESWNALDASSRVEIDEWARGGADVENIRTVAPIVDRSRILIAGSRRFAEPLQDNAPVVAMLKFKSAFADPTTEIALPDVSTRWDVDAVIGAIVGKSIFRLDSAAAADAIAGFVIMADVTDRARFEEEARTNNGLMAKNHFGASSIGPVVWLPDDPAVLPGTIEMHVNGELKQSLSLQDLFWTVGDIASRWSASTLSPGDIIGLGPAILREGQTKCPPAALHAGDVVAISCPEIGALRFTVGSRRAGSL